MNKQNIIAYLQSKKETFKEQYKITNIELYGSYARDKATTNIDTFYERNKSFELKKLIFNE